MSAYVIFLRDVLFRVFTYVYDAQFSNFYQEKN